MAGNGRTLAMSSVMVRFESDRPLPRDRRIRLVLAWPAALPDGTELNLWIAGVVTRSISGRTDVRVANYEFKTRRLHGISDPIRERPLAPFGTLSSVSPFPAH